MPPKLSRRTFPLTIDTTALVAEQFGQRLSTSGYTHVRVLAGVWCAVKRFNFTTAVVVGLDAMGYQRRYCYEHAVEAQAAIVNWDGKGHPSGPWIKCKGAGIDFLNPNFT